MNKSKALLALLFIATLTSSLIVMDSVSAQEITKPSVPQFTVEFVNHVIDTPTTYSVNPYTGENTTQPGEHREWQSLDLKIENQPFTSYNTSEGTSGWNVSLYYNVRVKGAFTDDWIELYRPSDGYPTQNASSQYTTISLGTLTESGITLETNARMVTIPFNGIVDFQVQAMEGYVHRIYNPNTTDQLQMFPWGFTGEVSGWTSTQTVTINGNNETRTPNPTQTEMPTQTQTQPETSTQQVIQNDEVPGLNWQQDTIILLSVIVIALLAVLLFSLKRKKQA